MTPEDSEAIYGEELSFPSCNFLAPFDNINLSLDKSLF